MKICVTAVAGDLDAEVDPRFGRCGYFVIVDPDTMAFEAVPNESVGAASGAGIQAAQTIVNKGVDVLISGNIGPNAFQTLSAAGVKVVTGAYGTVRDAINMYKRGELAETGGATVPGHFGMGTSPGTRGMGRRVNIEQQASMASRDVDELLERVKRLEDELEDIKKRIRR
ncbi:MAG: dinitrogenase iron-molybdenum cofactor biosynthesis protein [Candidatus Syntrophoarchaeum sp. WYZ-LMO15]|nr:MAG: dinitrogenase iron-molybdenum cofactor biosynthesis protein [Candidatus Syntrophoarchaeum sp. WYZ-LMO15]